MKHDDGDQVEELDRRRPRAPLEDRGQVAAALWALLGGLAWCRGELTTIGDPVGARELDAIEERIWNLADRLYSEGRPPGPYAAENLEALGRLLSGELPPAPDDPVVPFPGTEDAPEDPK